jgi:integrative and conjugative element protein (TIGR02256 family)
MLHHAIWESGHDGLETGGWLFGDAADAGVVVAHATGPGSRAARETHSLTLDHSDRAQFALRRMWGEPLTSRIGKWHTHPGGPAEPSVVDLESWEAGLDVISSESRQPYYVAVIATDHVSSSWELHTWLVSRSDTGKTFVERVRLEDLDAHAA